MIKKIPGSLEYRINLSGQIFDRKGNVVSLPEENGKLVITLFDKVRVVDHEWLALLAWYECGDINDLSKHIDKISFCDIDNTYLRVRCGKLMTFAEPIYYCDGFRHIPNYPRYAIDVNGNLLDTKTNCFVSDLKQDDKGYITCYIRVPDRDSNRAVKFHRLVAHAWVNNECFLTRTLVNHIDGVKANNDISNLEWCNTLENVNHALKHGLNNTSIPVKVREAYTGEITTYPSISSMNRELGISVGNSVTNFTSKLPGHLWDKRFEIKTLTDNTPWYYENVDISYNTPGKSIYTITVFNSGTGKTRKFNRVKQVSDEYKIPYRFETIDKFVVRFKELIPSCDIWYVKNSISGPYHVHDTLTSSLNTFSSLKEVSEFMGRTKSELQVDISRGLKYIYDSRWLIMLDSCNFNIDEYINKPKQAKAIQVLNVKSGELILAESIKDASRKTNINEKTIRYNLNSDKESKGYLFRALDQQ